jgi:hypothetical protein
MKNWFTKNIAYFLIGFVTIIIASYIYLIGKDLKAMTYFGDATQLLVALFAGISIPLLFGQKEYREKIHSLPWHFVGLGFLAWALGQAYWAFQEIVNGIDMGAVSYSLADIGFILLYPLVIIGFVIQGRFLGKLKLPPWWILLLMVGFAGLMTFFSWNALTTEYATGNMTAFILQIVYLLGDITIVVGSAVIAWNTRGGIISVAWSILLTSFIFFALGNQIYNFYDYSSAGYQTGSLIDLSWILSFIIAWVGANVFHTMLKDHN